MIIHPCYIDSVVFLSNHSRWTSLRRLVPITPFYMIICGFFAELCWSRICCSIALYITGLDISGAGDRGDCARGSVSTILSGG